MIYWNRIFEWSDLCKLWTKWNHTFGKLFTVACTNDLKMILKKHIKSNLYLNYIQNSELYSRKFKILEKNKISH